MELLTIYFIAPDDSAAAEVVGWTEGPGVRDENSGRGPYPSAEIEFDESVMLIRAAMSEFNPSETIPEGEIIEVLAEENGGELTVYRIPLLARDALARLASYPEYLCAVDAAENLGEPDKINEGAIAFIQLATSAQQRGWPVYGWVSLKW